MFFTVILGFVLQLEASSGVPIATGSWFNPTGSLQHYQDNSGSYHYSYSAPTHSKTETSSNGVTRGGYSYIDANGILQTVSYIADEKNGFRVKATNLPEQPKPVEDTPEVAAAKKRHLEELEKAISQNSLSSDAFSSQLQENEGKRDEDFPDNRPNPFLLREDEGKDIRIPEVGINFPNSPQFQQNFLPPAPFVLPLIPYRYVPGSLHHAQDSSGRYQYGYIGDTSSKMESRTSDGTTRGAYSYIDAHGLLRQVHYIADRNGFRVLAGSN